MVRLLIGLIITALTTVMGKRITDKYGRRLNFYTAMNNFNSDVFRDMAYKRDGLISALGKNYGDDGFDGYIKDVRACLIVGRDLPLPPDYIEENERIKIKEYFSEIGKFSFDAESDFLLSQRELFSGRIEQLKKETVKFSSLGAKLGFAIGMTVCIIII